MPSRFWDHALASRLRNFDFEFPQKPLHGRVIVVAGGTGGLGAATTWLLAAEGASLVVGYRSNRARADSLASRIEKHFSRRLSFVPGDIADPSVRRTFLDAAASLGPLYGAVILPGDPARVPFDSLDSSALHASVEANFAAPLLLARDLGTAMESAGTPGSLVFFSSMQALAPFPGSVNYAAPKAALVHASRILARQWSHVRVNVVAPGATVAGMAEASVSSGKYDSFVADSSIPRFGRPEDLARAVRFFLEPDNYITGQTLLVDGGLTLRS